MPWMIMHENSEFCVHKQNADGTAGDKLKCYGSKQDAADYMAALYASSPDAAAKFDLSLEARQTALQVALDPFRNPASQAPSSGVYIMETYDDHIIVCDGPAYYQVAYTVDAEGIVTLAARDQWKPVSQEWAAKHAARGFVKVAGDWELDVLAIPFGKPDTDGQVFDKDTDFMLDDFTSPPIIYFHGLNPARRQLQNKPIVVGKANGVTVQADGIHVRVILDKLAKFAASIWEAAKKGFAVASTGTLPYLARLEIDGKLVPYDKDKPGRIAIWPLGELSLWARGDTWSGPASQYAVATPMLKLHYEMAGITFPVVAESADGEAKLEAAGAAAKLSRKKALQRRARALLTTLE